MKKIDEFIDRLLNGALTLLALLSLVALWVLTGLVVFTLVTSFF